MVNGCIPVAMSGNITSLKELKTFNRPVTKPGFLFLLVENDCVIFDNTSCCLEIDNPRRILLFQFNVFKMNKSLSLVLYFHLEEGGMSVML
jgi:hypothetical protein